MNRGRAWLKNGNPVGDLRKARRCGARNRRGTPCQCPAMANGRCRLHGGLSTGPRTAAGIERIRRAVTKHGMYQASAGRTGTLSEAFATLPGHASWYSKRARIVIRLLA